MAGLANVGSCREKQRMHSDYSSGDLALTLLATLTGGGFSIRCLLSRASVKHGCSGISLLLRRYSLHLDGGGGKLELLLGVVRTMIEDTWRECRNKRSNYVELRL